MALNTVAPVLAKGFVTLKIDEDRVTGGKDPLKHYSSNGNDALSFSSQASTRPAICNAK